MKGTMKQASILSMFGRSAGGQRQEQPGQRAAASQPAKPANPKPAASKSPKSAPSTAAPSHPPGAGATTPAARASPPAPAANENRRASVGGVDAAVGMRIRVYWPDDKAWFAGTITELRGAKTQVTYDDGDVEVLDLSREQVELVDAAAADDAKRLADDARALEDDLSDLDADGGGGGGGGGGGAAPMEVAEGPPPAAAVDRSGAKSGKAVKAAPKRKAAATPAPAGSKRSKVASQPAKRGAAAVASPTENAASNGGNTVRPPKAPAATPATAPSAKTPAAAEKARTPATAGGASAQRTPVGSSRPLGSLATCLGSAMPSTEAADVRSGTPAGLNSRMVGDAARFLQRYNSSKFSFLLPENLKDAQRRPPTHPEYDPSTLYIPPNWVKEHKVSDGQAQWWQFKAANYDSILLFKMGKFYELFEMDAFVGVEALGLQFMKGDQPHAGFPEAAYYTMAEALARAGHRVVVVEQTETPEQLKEFNDQAGKGQKRKVVQRTKVAVLTQGTLTEPLMLSASPEAAYTVAVVELPATGRGAWVGVCAVDAAAAKVVLCQFADNELRSALQRQLSELQPAEVVVPRSAERMPVATKALLKGLLPGARVVVQGAADGAWDGAAVRRLLQAADVCQDAGGLPPAIAPLLDDAAANAASLAAFAGMVTYLTDAMLAKAVLGVGTITVAADGGVRPADSAAPSRDPADAPPGATMNMDGSALQNLEVLENTEGGKLGSVFATLDHCLTAGGKRLLRMWLTRPLVNVGDICARQDAVHVLMTVAGDARDAASGHFARMGDIERMVARLAGSAIGAFGRDGPNVVLYEDPGRKRVKEMTGVLADMQALRDAVDAFEPCLPSLASPTLTALLTWGQGMPDFRPTLDELLSAADWRAAEQAGQVVPAAGVDEAYDAAFEALAQVDADLQEHLDGVRAAVGKGVVYVSMNKDTHVLEVPEALASRVPRHYSAMSARKGFKRYSCEDLEALVAARKRAVEVVEVAQGSILASLVRRFASHRDLWLGACAAAAQLDVLMSLAKAALLSRDGGPMCRPNVTLTPPAADAGASAPPSGAFFSARALRHPTGITLASAASFVPNDIQLGVDSAPFMLLTGPNMGGKSTLMRQVCVATLMAQVGAWLPAEEVTLSPADAIFVRMGARDHIMMGQSTFFVELSETSAMLANATPRSLVALDELGRGTATMDGAAIAGAVLEHLLHNVGCRGVFATHYHALSQEHALDSRVAIKHMACHVRDADGDHLPQVTFLYKLSAGACPRSYGANVARIAGIPLAVAKRAALISEALECSGEDALPGTLLPGPAAGYFSTVLAAMDEPAADLGALVERGRDVVACLG